MSKKKIAILGGGLGSLSAAYWITEADDADQFEITVYQMGWRLGGKGASGRNHAYGERIEEHGLHIWFGFYENGFRTISGALDAISAMSPPPVATYPSWKEAFTPHSLVTFEEWWNGQWLNWPILFPHMPGQPGVGPVPDLATIIAGLLDWMIGQHEAHLGESRGHTAIDAARREIANLGANETVDGIVSDLVAGLVRVYLDALWLFCRGNLDDTDVRRFFILNDLAGTMLIGILRDRLISKGFESADGEDWIEWLGRHGAQQVTRESAPVRTVYDLVFGFEDGDTNKPNFAAGTCVRGVLRMIFTYKGALMWKMESGMGDTIFTPLYGILKARGVKFEFFHKVDALRAGDGGTIDEIDLTVQATTVNGAEYDPLVRVKALDCWPSEPHFDQLEQGEALRHDPNNPGEPYNLESWWTAWPGVGKKTLERGKHFDYVLSGVPVGALRYVAQDLAKRSRAWDRMLNGPHAVATTPTQGVQLWLKKTSEELGWVVKPERGYEPGELTGLVGGYEQALDTWADMSHTLPTEDWPADHDPKSVAYLCGPYVAEAPPPPFTDHAYPARETHRLYEQALAWIRQNAAHLWPKGASPAYPNGLDPELLVDPKDGTGAERFETQWFRANVDPNERYVLSVKGSTASRISPAASGFSNLFIAGDWTSNGVLNAGCVEATVASGMEASRAISGSPSKIEGER